MSGSSPVEPSGRTTPRRRSIDPWLHAAALLGLFAVWQLSAVLGLLNEFLVPRPTSVAASFVDMYWHTGAIYHHLFVTLCETLGGFAIGAGVGIALAVASALSGTFRTYVSPYAIVLNVTPGLALTPLVIAWFGFGWGSKIALAAIVSFFPVFVNVLTGLTESGGEREEMFRSLGATHLQIFRKLKVPQALPVAFAGLKIGMTTALVGAIVAEFAQATEGIGVIMQRYSFSLDMGSAIAALLSMSLLGLLLYGLLELADARLVFWRDAGRLDARARRRRAAMTRRYTDLSLPPSPQGSARS